MRIMTITLSKVGGVFRSPPPKRAPPKRALPKRAPPKRALQEPLDTSDPGYQEPIPESEVRGGSEGRCTFSGKGRVQDHSSSAVGCVGSSLISPAGPLGPAWPHARLLKKRCQQGGSVSALAAHMF